MDGVFSTENSVGVHGYSQKGNVIYFSSKDSPVYGIEEVKTIVNDFPLLDFKYEFAENPRGTFGRSVVYEGNVKKVPVHRDTAKDDPSFADLILSSIPEENSSESISI